MKIRQDAWSHEDDVLLAETVLNHIKEGSTQLRAFDEVGDALNRTSAACGFRWNAVVRQKHIHVIAEAKRERKERKRAASYPYYTRNVASPTLEASPVVEYERDTASSPTLASIISQLQQYAAHDRQTSAIEIENKELKAELNLLQRRLKELETAMQKNKQDHSMIEEDYQSLIQIMNRARRLAILEEEEGENATFKMDKNGNLEKVAK
ncbi:RsfA family transcriptional regulator [Shouchella shacheensis]|uniref:RsfA family transcriptional regulator n=1 Tax=Shouchella shacheensis TaxID=1649580 RepID=UPI00073FD78A|nr:RsfA family transcriptional regulator [Shouchella shacheensis]